MFNYILKWRHLVYDYSHFYLCGLYLLVFCLDAYILLKSAWNKKLQEWWKRFFHIFLLTGCSSELLFK